MADLRPGQVETAGDMRPGKPQGGDSARPIVVRAEQQRRHDGRADSAFGAPPGAHSGVVRLGHACAQIDSTSLREGVPQLALRRGQLLV
ncbi:hypothetical protein [Streptomyces sp. PU-14G]|uniref:hypothetical protein n=1 Tax=Streptomyces sp. PU-14G TaxID=2800808 RepID=UPI0034DE00FA